MIYSTRLAVVSFGCGVIRVWCQVGGALLSRIVTPAPADGLDSAPNYSYNNLHIDKFNRQFYDYSALL